MIDLISRSKAPAYKGASPTTNGKAGLLSGLWCYLFGAGSAPAYREAHTHGATAPTTSRCWWSFSGSPQYKTPPVPTPSGPDSEVPSQDGEPTGEDGAPEPLVAREILVYRAE